MNALSPSHDELMNKISELKSKKLKTHKQIEKQWDTLKADIRAKYHKKYKVSPKGEKEGKTIMNQYIDAKADMEVTKKLIDDFEGILKKASSAVSPPAASSSSSSSDPQFDIELSPPLATPPVSTEEKFIEGLEGMKFTPPKHKGTAPLTSPSSPKTPEASKGSAFMATSFAEALEKQTKDYEEAVALINKKDKTGKLLKDLENKYKDKFKLPKSEDIPEDHQSIFRGRVVKLVKELEESESSESHPIEKVMKNKKITTISNILSLSEDIEDDDDDIKRADIIKSLDKIRFNPVVKDVLSKKSIEEFSDEELKTIVTGASAEWSQQISELKGLEAIKAQITADKVQGNLDILIIDGRFDTNIEEFEDKRDNSISEKIDDLYILMGIDKSQVGKIDKNIKKIIKLRAHQIVDLEINKEIKKFIKENQILEEKSLKTQPEETVDYLKLTPIKFQEIVEHNKTTGDKLKKIGKKLNQETGIKEKLHPLRFPETTKTGRGIKETKALMIKIYNAYKYGKGEPLNLTESEETEAIKYYESIKTPKQLMDFLKLGVHKNYDNDVFEGIKAKMGPLGSNKQVKLLSGIIETLKKEYHQDIASHSRLKRQERISKMLESIKSVIDNTNALIKKESGPIDLQ
jgi:hypothetical protein